MCLETLSSAEAAGGKLSAFAKADARTQSLSSASRRSEVGRAAGNGELVGMESRGHLQGSLQPCGSECSPQGPAEGPSSDGNGGRQRFAGAFSACRANLRSAYRSPRSPSTNAAMSFALTGANLWLMKTCLHPLEEVVALLEERSHMGTIAQGQL